MSDFLEKKKNEYKIEEKFDSEQKQDQKYSGVEDLLTKEVEEKTQEEKFNEEINALVLTESQRVLDRAQAEDAAGGEPAAEFKPARKGIWGFFKDLIDKFRMRKLKKENRWLTLDSFRCVERLKDRVPFGNEEVVAITKQLGISTEFHKDPMVDGRAVNAMCKHYKKDKNGKPVSEEGRQAYEYNKSMIEAFHSHDLNAVRPYLQDLVRDCLNLKVCKGAINLAWVAENPEHEVNMAKLTYIQECTNKEWLKPFFDSLPKGVMELLDAKMTAYATLKVILGSYADLTGVTLTNGIIMKQGKNAEPGQDTRELMPLYEDKYRENRATLLEIAQRNVNQSKEGKALTTNQLEQIAKEELSHEKEESSYENEVDEAISGFKDDGVRTALRQRVKNTQKTVKDKTADVEFLKLLKDNYDEIKALKGEAGGYETGMDDVCHHMSELIEKVFGMKISEENRDDLKKLIELTNSRYFLGADFIASIFSSNTYANLSAKTAREIAAPIAKF